MIRTSSLSARNNSKSFKYTRKKPKDESESIVLFVLGQRVVPLDGGCDLSRLIYKIQASVISVSATIREYAMDYMFKINSTIGKKNQALTKATEKIFLNALSTSGATCIVASDRCENEYYLQENMRGEYIVTFVPIEGDLSNPAGPLGSIFTIFRRSRAGKLMDLELMQPGRRIICCGYALYGPVTTLVLALAHGVGTHQFVLDPDTNNFIKTPRKLLVPKRGNYYSINEGLGYSFAKNIIKYFKLKKDVKKLHLVNECVFTGSLVADFHSILKNGGIMLKPSYRDVPAGKYLLQFVINPFAFIMIEAGGLSTDGKTEITSLEVTKPRLYSPLYCGSPEDISELVRFTSNMRNFKL